MKKTTYLYALLAAVAVYWLYRRQQVAAAGAAGLQTQGLSDPFNGGFI